MSSFVLPFEKPIIELERKLNELQSASKDQNIDVSSEARRMERKIQEMREKIYHSLTPWQKVQMSRHPLRPYTLDYVTRICEDVEELHGDRLYRDDRAILGWLAHIGNRKVMVIGTQKGRDTKANLECNFGCPFPEGYRKALRLMRLADRFKLPIITFIDTAGAFPGLESEQRHVAEAIAVNLREMFTFKVPIISVVIGEGGSGGALGIGICNRLLILEHAYYSVISPEGCAAILWKDRKFADKAAEALKLTAPELQKMNLCDEVIPEPLGGAHRDMDQVAATVKDTILRHLHELDNLSAQGLLEDRYKKFRAMGPFAEDRKK